MWSDGLVDPADHFGGRVASSYSVSKVTHTLAGFHGARRRDATPGLVARVPRQAGIVSISGPNGLRISPAAAARSTSRVSAAPPETPGRRNLGVQHGIDFAMSRWAAWGRQERWLKAFQMRRTPAPRRLGLGRRCDQGLFQPRRQDHGRRRRFFFCKAAQAAARTRRDPASAPA